MNRIFLIVYLAAQVAVGGDMPSKPSLSLRPLRIERLSVQQLETAPLPWLFVRLDNAALDSLDCFIQQLDASGTHDGVQAWRNLLELHRAFRGADRHSYLGIIKRRIIAEYYETGMTDNLLLQLEAARKLSGKVQACERIHSTDD